MSRRRVIGTLSDNPNVFGVEWNYASSSPTLIRLTKASDPNKLVTVDITSNVTAAVGTSSGSSPFDSYFPWKDMDEYNISTSGVVGAKRGQSGFNRVGIDTFVRIPKFWYKIEHKHAQPPLWEKKAPVKKKVRKILI